MEKGGKFIRRWGINLIGGVLIAVGIYNFAVQAQFPMTGFSGISIILYRLWNIPIGLSTVALNIPLAFLCYRFIGKHFLISSVICMAVTSFLIDYAAPFLPVYTGSRLLAALCTGVFTGVGYALIYMQRSSTGGADFITMTVKSKKPYWSVGRIAFVMDMMIVFAGGYLLKDIDGIIYGMIVSFLATTVIDKMMYGINAGKMTLIVTEHGKQICGVIDRCCMRGSTILHGAGGYKNEQKAVVMCACSNKEMYQVQQAVKEADPASFMIILESNEVHGEGFRTVRIGEKERKRK